MPTSTTPNLTERQLQRAALARQLRGSTPEPVRRLLDAALPLPLPFTHKWWQLIVHQEVDDDAGRAVGPGVG